MHIMRSPAEEARALAADLADLHTAVRLCSRCFIFSESDPCKICADPGRNQDVVCVVEGPDDLLAIEKTGAYHGLYHILHGVLAPMDGIGPDEIKINELVDRVRREKIAEILVWWPAARILCERCQQGGVHPTLETIIEPDPHPDTETPTAD